MRVRLARTAGFCMGVRRAIDIVLTEANRSQEPIYTFGPLIHNNQVLELLSSKGVRSVQSVGGIDGGRLVIRAHGIAPRQRSRLRDSGLKIIDATCPRVARVQSIIRSYTRKGFTAVIVGDKDHAEVQGLKGFSHGPVYVIQDPEEVPDLPQLERVFAVAQTTQNAEIFGEIVEAVKERFSEVLVFDTICEATRERQQEVKALAEQTDGVVVVGGYHSANTGRLVEISRATGTPTFHVETEADLEKRSLSTMAMVGVTAGASTPNWMIKKVVKEIEGIRSRRDRPLQRWLREGLRFLLLSNGLAALGAFSLAFAAGVARSGRPEWAAPAVAFLYIYAMHVLNRFLDRGASAYNDPARASFLKRHRTHLLATAVGAVAGALAISYLMGWACLVALAAISLLGVTYSIPLVPKGVRDRWRYVKIKDIPGSRGLSESLAWMAVIGVLPLLDGRAFRLPSAIGVGAVVLLLAYSRVSLFDLFQKQGDLIVGTETLPIVLGERRTLLLVKLCLLSGGVLAFGCGVFGPDTGVFGPMLASAGMLAVCVICYERSLIYPGPALEALVESAFLLTGVLAAVWVWL